MLINFFIINLVPGGPLEQLLHRASSSEIDNASFLDNDAIDSLISVTKKSKYDAATEHMRAMYGFDKPLAIRFFTTMKNYLLFDFGNSFFSGMKVIDVIKMHIPVSFSLALWSTILTYLISIPLGIKKAVRRDGSFDIVTDIAVNALHAIPNFMLAILLLLLFANGGLFNIFPTRGFLSENWSELTSFAKIKDYFLHITLPVVSIVLGHLAFLVFLCKKSFISELKKQYVVAAFAKGLSERKVLYMHVFRNAMLVAIVNFPIFLLHSFLHGSMIIEIVFSLNGLGLLSFEAITNRDYPMIFAMLYIFTIFGLLIHILSDVLCFIVDKRVSFDGINP
ncbi:ABC transporter permease subunit [Candidatus Xenohaliotis californiensis]